MPLIPGDALNIVSQVVYTNKKHAVVKLMIFAGKNFMKTDEGLVILEFMETLKLPFIIPESMEEIDLAFEGWRFYSK